MRIGGRDIFVKGVLFDLDGTLIDSKLDIADAANAARARFGLPPLPVAGVLPFIGFGIRHLIAGVLDTKDETRVEDGLKAALAHYDGHLGEKTILFEGARELLEELNRRGIACGVVSNKPHPLTLRTLQILRINHLFKAAFGDQPGVRRKPDPEAVHVALQLMGVAATDCVFVGDSSVDVETARNAGMPAILLTHGFGDLQEARNMDPDLIAHSLSELQTLLK
jgi:phosphoglycolate phosphatase